MNVWVKAVGGKPLWQGYDGGCKASVYTRCSFSFGFTPTPLHLQKRIRTSSNLFSTAFGAGTAWISLSLSLSPHPLPEVVFSVSLTSTPKAAESESKQAGLVRYRRNALAGARFHHCQAPNTYFLKERGVFT